MPAVPGVGGGGVFYVDGDARGDRGLRVLQRTGRPAERLAGLRPAGADIALVGGPEAAAQPTLLGIAGHGRGGEVVVRGVVVRGRLDHPRVVRPVGGRVGCGRRPAGTGLVARRGSGGAGSGCRGVGGGGSSGVTGAGAGSGADGGGVGASGLLIGDLGPGRGPGVGGPGRGRGPVVGGLVAGRCVVRRRRRFVTGAGCLGRDAAIARRRRPVGGREGRSGRCGLGGRAVVVGDRVAVRRCRRTGRGGVGLREIGADDAHRGRASCGRACCGGGAARTTGDRDGGPAGVALLVIGRLACGATAGLLTRRPLIAARRGGFPSCCGLPRGAGVLRALVAAGLPAVRVPAVPLLRTGRCGAAPVTLVAGGALLLAGTLPVLALVA